MLAPGNYGRHVAPGDYIHETSRGKSHMWKNKYILNQPRWFKYIFTIFYLLTQHNWVKYTVYLLLLTSSNILNDMLILPIDCLNHFPDIDHVHHEPFPLSPEIWRRFDMVCRARWRELQIFALGSDRRYKQETTLIQHLSTLFIMHFTLVPSWYDNWGRLNIKPEFFPSVKSTVIEGAT